MRLGVLIPQGCDCEYRGWQATTAWTRVVQLAQLAEGVGLESIWVYDHLHTYPVPTDAILFESFTSLAALAMVTKRVRLGHLVVSTGFRNPALTAKMVNTLDVISGGRMELGIGAGWRKEEWVAYGYEFPPTRMRLATLADHLEIISRMMTAGQATYIGKFARVSGAFNSPKPVQPRVPITIGGNGPSVTWRLAARFADEINLDGMSPLEVREALPVIAQRCEEIGRDPSSLRVSVHVWAGDIERGGRERVDRLAEYRACGVSRLIAQLLVAVRDTEALESLADDARAAGVDLV